MVLTSSASTMLYGGPSVRKGKYTMPPQGAMPAEFRRHFDTVCDPLSEHRVELFREWNIARGYYLSEQWQKLDTTLTTDPRVSVRFARQPPNARIPRPVENEILPIVDLESSKQYRRKSTAYVRPVAVQEGTGGSAGAAKANDIMDWHLETISWGEKRRTAIFREVLYGTAFFWSYLEQSYLKTVRIGITDARRCSRGCNFALSALDLPADPLRQRYGALMNNPTRIRQDTNLDESTGMVEHSYQALGCLKCGGPLEPFTPQADALDSPDALGRPLFDEVPLNQPSIDVPAPHEMYIENDGIGFSSPHEIRRFYRCVPRSTEWLWEHYAHLGDDLAKLKPESPDKIAQYYPIDGVYNYGSITHTRPVWRDHHLVRTGICLPYRRGSNDEYGNTNIEDSGDGGELGRYVEMAGDLLLRDEPLMRPSKRKPDVLVPMVSIACVRFLVKDGETFGQGIVRSNFSPQNRVNMIMSQITDTRQRNGVPGIMATEGMHLTGGWLDGYTGRIVRWKPDEGHPTFKPEPLNTRLMDPGVYQELDRTIQRMYERVGVQDVDMGKAPKNVSAATAIQLLLDQSAGRREGREQEMIEALKQVFSHQLLLMAEYAIEPREYRAPTKSGQTWEYRIFNGMDLEGHTDVMVEEQSGYDARSFEREATTQAVQLGLLQPTTPYSRREILKSMGVPLRALDEQNLQIGDAEAKWYAFRDFSLVPVIDPDLDDHTLMYTTYGRFLKTPEGASMAQAAGWSQTLVLIDGWRDRLTQAQLLDAQIRKVVAAAKSQDPASVLAVQNLQARGVDVGAMQLPPDPAQQILLVWGRMGADINNPFVQFQAVVRAHLVLAEQKKAAAMGGPVLAAPGGGGTTAGTESVLGSTATPGTGTPQEAAALPAGAAAPQA